MTRQILCNLLTILIALQSVIAVADVHQFHQSDAEHISIGQEQDASAVLQNGLNGTDSGASADCQHCCHCHGVCHPFMSFAQASLELFVPSIALPAYHFSSSSHQASPDNPPPIS